MAGKSTIDRRTARQRQLDMMEAEASGTAVSMELDTAAADSEGRFVSIRQRNKETARRFLYDEDEALQITALTKNTTSAGGFATRSVTTNAVNLMDHEAGLYARQDNSFMTRLKRFFFGAEQTNSENDAMAADTEVYFGDQRPPRSSSSSTTTASTCATVCGRARYIFRSSKHRVLTMLILFLAVFMLIFFTLRALKGSSTPPTPEQVLRSANSERFNQIMDHIIIQGVTDPRNFLVKTSAQSRALRWIAYTDPARIDPDDSMILQRFALAVFFYNSFMFFERSAGRQKAIETEDDQFEGVPIAGWMIQSNWLTEKGICTWYGVECERRTVDGIDMQKYDDNAPVHALNLTGNTVWGTIPFEIKALHSIERLDLSRNRISGKFPREVRFLPRLKHVYLTKNRMTGELPQEIGHMQKTVELLLNQNKFSGSIPTEINRLSNVRVLDLSENLLTNQFPAINGMSNLKYLHLASNDFSGTLPFSLSELHELHEIHVEKNKFSGTIPPEMESLLNLRIIFAHDNLLTGKLPDGLFESNKELEHVTINHNKFTGPLPPSAGQLAHLHTLDMHNNLFSGSFPTEWTNMPKLQVLHLQNNRMQGSIPATIGKLRSVKELWLSNNTITGPIPGEISECKSLEFAYLEQNQMSGKLPSEMGGMKGLETIRLESNLFTGFVPQQLCNLKSFDRLKFISSDCTSGNLQCSCCNRCY